MMHHAVHTRAQPNRCARSLKKIRRCVLAGSRCSRLCRYACQVRRWTSGSRQMLTNRSRRASPGVRALRVARRYAGVRYHWGGESPLRGFDCSGLVQFAFGRVGVRVDQAVVMVKPIILGRWKKLVKSRKG